MSTATFDTYAAVKTLREAGADEAMAEAIVNTASAAAGADREQLATKADLAELETRLTARMDTFATKADLAALRAELGDHPMDGRLDRRVPVRHRPSSVRVDLTRALWIQGGAIVAILTALRFFPA